MIVSIASTASWYDDEDDKSFNSIVTSWRLFNNNLMSDYFIMVHLTLLGLTVVPFNPVYSATKFGVVGYSRCVAVCTVDHRYRQILPLACFHCACDVVHV